MRLRKGYLQTGKVNGRVDMIYIGIDPGKQGAIGMIGVNIDYRCSDIPLLCNKEIDSKFIRENILNDLPKKVICFVEKAQAMPQQGVVSTFKYGMGYGKILAVLEILKIPYQEISSQKWKRHFNLIKKDKRESVAVAKKLFPDIEYQTKRGRLLDGRAEAILIAEFCRRTYEK